MPDEMNKDEQFRRFVDELRQQADELDARAFKSYGTTRGGDAMHTAAHHMRNLADYLPIHRTIAEAAGLDFPRRIPPPFLRVIDGCDTATEDERGEPVD